MMPCPDPRPAHVVNQPPGDMQMSLMQEFKEIEKRHGVQRIGKEFKKT